MRRRHRLNVPVGEVACRRQTSVSAVEPPFLDRAFQLRYRSLKANIQAARVSESRPRNGCYAPLVGLPTISKDSLRVPMRHFRRRASVRVQRGVRHYREHRSGSGFQCRRWIWKRGNVFAPAAPLEEGGRYR